MNKTQILKAITSLKMATRKHSPEILTGIGLAGMITTTVLAVRATPKAVTLLSEIKERYEDDPDKKEMSIDVVKNVLPLYLPATVIGCMSVGCIIGASSINFRRNAALATAYTLSESALREYQQKVVETVGNKKEEEIRGAIAQDHLDRNPISNSEVIITGKGETMCFDSISGRYFKSDIEKLRKIENELNRQMLRDNYISLNDFYYEVGLSNTKNGRDLGWRIDRGFIELSFSAKLTEDDEPCIVLNYSLAPQYDYDR